MAENDIYNSQGEYERFKANPKVYMGKISFKRI